MSGQPLSRQLGLFNVWCLGVGRLGGIGKRGLGVGAFDTVRWVETKFICEFFRSECYTSTAISPDTSFAR